MPRRESGVRELRLKHFVYCQGETEKIYLESLKETMSSKDKYYFDISSVNPQKMYRKVIRKISVQDKRIAIDYDKVWLVFDKDKYSDYSSTIEEIEKRRTSEETADFIAIWSNICFELWILLHYRYVDEPYTAADYDNELSRIIGIEYNKTDKRYFAGIAGDRVDIAIENSIRLFESYSGCEKHNCNPVTNVHILVNEMIR